MTFKHVLMKIVHFSENMVIEVKRLDEIFQNFLYFVSSA